MERLDTSPWNLSLNLALPLTMALACGPVVAIDDGGTDTDPDPTDPSSPTDPSDPSDPSLPTDPTTQPYECSEAVPCGYGYQCLGGHCEPVGCVDGGCCYEGEGGCCYYDDGGCCYGETGGCYYEYCSTTVECGGAEYCNGFECEPANMVGECATPFAFIAVVPAIPEQGVISLSFVELDGDPARELAVGSVSGAVTTAIDAAAATALPLPADTVAFDIGAGDLDADGDVDLVVAGGGKAPAVLILDNDGLGSFTAGTSDLLAASRIEIADVDGDAIADLIGVLDLGTPSPQAAVMQGLGGGVYAPPYIHSPDAGPLDLEVGELFGDPGVELVMFDGNAMPIWRGGTLDGTADFWFDGVGGAPGAVAIGDFDGDGLVDVARVITQQGWTLIDVFHDIGGNFEPSYTQTIAGSFDRAEAGDLDGDGRDDLVLAGSDGTFAVLPGTTWDYPQPLACVSVFASGLGASQALALGDYDGDGLTDVALADGNAVVVQVRTP
jgi:FG-GAP-like repeat